jgi:hypothetical protein
MVQFGRIVLDSVNSHTVSRLREAKGLSPSAARCFAALSMTGLDLSVAEELSSSFEPCLKLHRILCATMVIEDISTMTIVLC